MRAAGPTWRGGTRMTRQQAAFVSALGAVLCWSTVATAFKLTLRALSVTELLTYSSFASCLALGLFLLFRSEPKTLGTWPRREVVHSALLGFLNPFAYYLVLFNAYNRLPAQEAQPLNYSWPLVLALLSIIVLRQRITLRALAAMLVSFAGVWVISTRGDVFGLSFADPLGVGLAVGSSAIWAVYWLLTMRSTADPVEKLFVNAVFGCVYVGLYLLLTGPLRVPPLDGVIGAVYVGVFEMGITFVLWLYALRHSTTTAQVGNLVYLSPFVSLIFIHFVVGESIEASTFVGLVLIVGGIITQQMLQRRDRSGSMDNHGVASR